MDAILREILVDWILQNCECGSEPDAPYVLIFKDNTTIDVTALAMFLEDNPVAQ